ncbi:chymotrypsin-C-like isoform X2 [Symsagittifera roscoffensis]|uniref:chymotrypsin-C-like isoform X2 n=1 Tax=Symsagittifera roscoffensis TaxID=84072 RepID=UPI00307C2219
MKIVLGNIRIIVTCLIGEVIAMISVMESFDYAYGNIELICVNTETQPFKDGCWYHQFDKSDCSSIFLVCYKSRKINYNQSVSSHVTSKKRTLGRNFETPTGSEDDSYNIESITTPVPELLIKDSKSGETYKDDQLLVSGEGRIDYNKSGNDSKTVLVDRVINGFNVKITNHPWTVYMEMCNGDECSLCGGTLIDQYSVLTAKHCVRGDVNGNCDGSIFVGNRRPNQGSTFNFGCGDSQVLRNGAFDLAMIKTSQAMVGTPLAVPRGPEEGTRGGQNAYVLGWGRVCDADGKSCSGQNDQATTIQGVTIEIHDGCAYQPAPPMFCGGGYDSQGYPRDACIGDSGGTVECKDVQVAVWETEDQYEDDGCNIQEKSDHLVLLATSMSMLPSHYIHNR